MADNFLNKIGLAYFYNRIKTVFASQDDFDTLEARVEGIASEGGEPNVIDTVKVNGTALAVTDKAVDVTVPTTVAELTDSADYAQASDIPTAVSELTNDAGYQTASDVETAIGDALDGVTGISYESVSELPQTGETGVIYLVPKTGGSGSNVKDEYIWTGSAFEKIGDTEVDLSGYWSKEELTAITTAEVDEIIDSE